MSNNEYGYLASNFSFSFNRIKNFNRYVKLSHQGLENSLTDLIADMTNGLYEKDLECKKDIYDPFDNTKIAYLSVFGFDGYLIDPVVSGGTQWKSAVVGAPAAGYKLHESGHIDDYNFTYSVFRCRHIPVLPTLHIRRISRMEILVLRPVPITAVRASI